MSTGPVQHNPQQITQGYMGPNVPVGIPRQKVLFSSNRAPSYIPDVLLNQEGRIARPVEEMVVRPFPNEYLLWDLRGDLGIHMETKIQLFLQQLLLVYRTNLCFMFYMHADFQVGNVPTNGKGGSSYVAAHSGTFSTLRLKTTESPEEAPVSFAQDTHFYDVWNTTIYLPECINQVDSKIDQSGPEDQWLRTKAWQILNAVSTGQINPQVGLRYFLLYLWNSFERVEQDTEFSAAKNTALWFYCDVVADYWEKLDKGFPLIQRLCLENPLTPVDESFFSRVQHELHQRLKTALVRLQPAPVELPTLGFDVSHLQSLIGTKMGIRKSTETTRAYVKLSSTSPSVQAAAGLYLAFLHRLHPPVQDQELKRILNVKTLATIDRLHLSEPARNFYFSVLQVLASKTKGPKKMGHILLSVLIEVSHLYSRRSLQTVPKVKDPLLVGRVRQIIQTTIEGANIEWTQKSQDYFHKCFDEERVKIASMAVFNRLIGLPDPLQRIETSAILDLTKASLGTSGVSDEVVGLYGLVLETIRTKFGLKEPQKVPLILLRLLFDVSASI